MLQEFLHNFLHNLFKPLLLFFYFGFLIRMLKNERLSAEDRAALEEILRESQSATTRRTRGRSTSSPPEGP